MKKLIGVILFSLLIMGCNQNTKPEEDTGYIETESSDETFVEETKPSDINEQIGDSEVVEFMGTQELVEPAALPLAAQSQDMETVKALIEEGVDINQTDASGATALHWAANKGDYEMALYLIENGGDPKIEDDDFGATPLNWAAFDGSLDIVMLLIDNGADINTQNIWGNTPLHNAITQNNIDMVGYLIGQGADTDIMNNNGETPLVLAQSLANPEILRLLE